MPTVYGCLKENTTIPIKFQIKHLKEKRWIELNVRLFFLFQVYSDDTIEDMREEKVTPLKFISLIQLRALFNLFILNNLDVPISIFQNILLYSMCPFAHHDDWLPFSKVVLDHPEVADKLLKSNAKVPNNFLDSSLSVKLKGWRSPLLLNWSLVANSASADATDAALSSK